MKKTIICIEKWMVDKIGLNGNNLVLFALLWQNSNKGRDDVKVDYTEASAAIGTTIPTMYNCLRAMCQREIITQVDRGVYHLKAEF